MIITRERDRMSGAPAPMIDLRPLLGSWVSYDPDTTGIVGVRISDRRGVLTVRVAGAWKPKPQDWGIAIGAAFSAGVTSSEAVGFTTHYRLDEVTVLLTAYLNKRLLVLDAYSTFADGRANYFQRDHLYLR